MFVHFGEFRPLASSAAPPAPRSATSRSISSTLNFQAPPSRTAYTSRRFAHRVELLGRDAEQLGGFFQLIELAGHRALLGPDGEVRVHGVRPTRRGGRPCRSETQCASHVLSLLQLRANLPRQRVGAVELLHL